LLWAKTSKGHYEAVDGKSSSVFCIDVYEPDKERYFWLVSQTSEAGLDIEIGGTDHLPEAKALVAKAVAGKKFKSARATKADDRAVILECSRKRTAGTVAPPKAAKIAVAV
jgi:dihydroxyacetone kinase